MYYDLNSIPGRKDAHARRALVAAALRLGYDGVAFNHVVEGPMTAKDACDWAPLDLKSVLACLPGGIPRSRQGLAPGGGRPAPRQLARVTLATGDTAHLAALNKGNELLRPFDLVAIQPESLPVFAKACSSLEVDVISLDLSKRLPFRFRPPVVAAALKRGVVFEICYAAALRDPAARSQFFSNAKALLTATRGKGVVISSGASRPSEVRAPLDAANLATLAGLSTERARAAISVECQALLLRAKARTALFSAAIEVEKKASGSGRSTDGAGMDRPSPSFAVPEAWDPFVGTGTADSAGELNFDADVRDSFGNVNTRRVHPAAPAAGDERMDVERGNAGGEPPGSVANGRGAGTDYVPMTVDGSGWTTVQRGSRQREGRQRQEPGKRGGSPWKKRKQNVRDR